MARLDPRNGDLEALLPFRNVHSPVLINERFYLQESAQWWISKGNLLEVNPSTLEVKTLYRESTKRGMGSIYDREIAEWTEDKILFFGDGHLRSCHVPTGTISQVLDDTYRQLGGLLTVGEHVFLIAGFDWERDPTLRDQPNFQKVLHFDGTRQIDIVVDEDDFLGSVTYSGSVQYRKEGDAIATFAGLVFHVQGPNFQKIGRLVVDDRFNRPTQTAQSVRFGEHEYVIFDTHCGNYAEEVGFVLGTVDASNHYTRQEYHLSGKRKGFGSDVVHAFGDRLVVCGAGRYSLLRLK